MGFNPYSQMIKNYSHVFDHVIQLFAFCLKSLFEIFYIYIVTKEKWISYTDLVLSDQIQCIFFDVKPNSAPFHWCQTRFCAFLDLYPDLVRGIECQTRCIMFSLMSSHV